MKNKRVHSWERRGLLCAFLLGILLMSWVCRARAEEEISVTAKQMQGTVINTGSLNVRSGPGKDHKAIGTVKEGDALTITGLAENGWYRIELNGETGYVSNKYVEAEEIQEEEPDKEEPEEKEEGEPETGYRGLHQSPHTVKIAVCAALILVILILIFFTVRGFRNSDDDDGYDDDEDEDEDDEEDEDDDEDEDDGGEENEDDGGDEDEEEEEDGDSGADPVKEKRRSRRAYILREEDYRVEIDPSFFEDKEVIEQPPMATGYLERQKIEEEARKAEQAKKGGQGGKAASGTQEAEKEKEIAQAMKKLNELQREIERLKNQ